MRRSGILLPVSSLYGDYSIGTLGKCAYDFIDFLYRSGQYYWQILPINPTAYGNSPYQSPCVFAGNPYFIDLEFLVNDGLISEKDILPLKKENRCKADYEHLYKTRLPILKKAAENVDTKDSTYLSFVDENKFWLSDYGAYMALKEKNNMLAWDKWHKKAKNYSELSYEGLLHCKIQFLFFRQWIALKKYANDKGVRIIGDLPIYPSKDSSDYYFCQSDYLKDVVAGCPPDAFSPNGQLWGNPIYDWKKMQKEGFPWWKERLKQAQKLFDCVRIDHFRGIYEYYSVKENSPTAIDGKWTKGPGMDFVRMIRESFPTLTIIAEDLGFLTDEARAFFEESGFPGMKILQFAFDSTDSEYLPHNYQRNSVAYTGTHDNPTVIQWLCRSESKTVNYAMDYLGAFSVCALPDCFIRAVMASVCDTAIIPLQDWLKIGCKGRINTPGVLGGNWEYRIKKEDLSDKAADKILSYTKLFKRIQEE